MTNVNKDELVNLVKFGKIKWWSGKEPNEIEGHLIESSKDKKGISYWLPVAESEGSEPHIGVEWNEPRDVHKIVVTYKNKEFTLKSGLVRVEYWQNS